MFLNMAEELVWGRMGDRSLKWGLRLLTILLIIVPLLVVFWTNNWDIKAAVLPSENEINGVENSVTGIFNENSTGNVLSIVSITSTEVEVRFASPFNIPIKIDNISVSVSNQGENLGLATLGNEVEVPANATENIWLVWTYTGEPPTSPGLSGGNITFEVYGITVQVQTSGGQGGPSF
jgi:hypothetical protein